MGEELYEVISITREDLIELGFDSDDFSDEDMKSIASNLFDLLHECDFDDKLEQAANMVLTKRDSDDRKAAFGY